MKTFRNIGLLAIVAFSFFYTEKIANLVLENNELYKTIDDVKEDYTVASIDAEVYGDYIIPGLNGLEVNVKDSYFNMKGLNAFNEYYLLYDCIYPSVSLSDNKDKIITQGNSKKQSVSFILEYDKNIILKFMEYLKVKGYKYTIIELADVLDIKRSTLYRKIGGIRKINGKF